MQHGKPKNFNSGGEALSHKLHIAGTYKRHKRVIVPPFSQSTQKRHFEMYPLWQASLKCLGRDLSVDGRLDVSKCIRINADVAIVSLSNWDLYISSS